MPVVDVPGHGDVEFPDSMKDEEIVAAIKKLSPAAPQAEQPGALRSAAEGALTGAGYGWRDELVGGYKALAKHVLPKSLGGTDLPLGEQYRQDRDAVRAQQEAAQKAHPVAYGAGELGGGLASGAAATALTGGTSALPMALAQGGMAGAGYSNATTPGGLARDAGLGVGIGGLGYGAGAAIGKAASSLAGFAGRGARLAESRAASKAADEIAGRVASDTGKYGGLRQTENNALLSLLEAESKGRLNPATQARLDALKASGRIEEALNETASNNLDFLAERTPQVMAAKEAMQQTRSGASDALKKRTEELLSTDEMKKQLLTRALRYGPVAAGTALGMAVGGPLGTGIGALAGAGTRPMIRSMRNLAKSPAAQKAIFEAIENGAPQIGTFLRRAIQASAAGPLTEAAVAP